MSNLYAILGVSRTAKSNEIKSAYRRLARLYHPDVNADPAAAAKFAQINEAYQTLIDPEKRRSYDRSGNPRLARHSQTTAARVARRAYYQARADRIVNDWLEREREETRARGKAVYTTVSLFLSTFLVAMIKPEIFETSTPFWRVALLAFFGAGVWHLVRSLKSHFDHYTYRSGRRSSSRAIKPFKRSVAWAFVIGGYLLSFATGLLIGMLTEDYTANLLGGGTIYDAVLKVLFYPPMAVLIVDTIYLINIRLEDL